MTTSPISNTPGMSRIFVGVVIFGFSFLVFHAFRYQLGDMSRLILFAIMLYGAVQFGRGLFEWKYTDRKLFTFLRQRENLFIDVPLREHDASMLHKIEDEVLLKVGKSKRIKMHGHTIDAPNKMGTIHLYGGEADAMFAQVYSALSQHALPGGVHIFPKQGMPVDTAINGKRVLIDLQSKGVN